MGETDGKVRMVRGEALGCHGRLQKNLIADVQGLAQPFGHVFADGAFAVFHFGDMPLRYAGFLASSLWVMPSLARAPRRQRPGISWSVRSGKYSRQGTVLEVSKKPMVLRAARVIDDLQAALN
jgi:hypothetical protein